MEYLDNDPCTVQTLIAHGIFRPESVLAGSSGLNRPLSLVSVIEVPDIAPWVHPGELLITTAFAFKDNPQLLEDLVATFADQQLAGLAIKPRRFLGDLPRQFLAHADEKGFPIIEVDPHVTYGGLLKQISELILNHNVASKTQFLETVYKELTKALVDREGLDGLGSRLANILDRPVMIESVGAARRYFAPRGVHVSEVEQAFSVVAWQRSHYITDRVIVYDAECLPGLPYGSTLQVRVGGRLQHGGSIFVIDRTLGVSDVLIKAVEYAASLAAVEMMRIETVDQVNQQYRNAFLAEWLDGRIADRLHIVSQGQQFGWQLQRDHFLVLIRPREGCPLPMDGGPEPCIWFTKGRDIAILIPEEAGITVGEAIGQVLKRQGLGLDAAAVADSIDLVPSDNMAATASELAEMLDVAEVMGATGRITRQSLGIYALWPLIPDKEKLREFLWKDLSSIILYDQSHHTQLMKTLEAFLDARGNVAATAKKLFVHYNTVLYRLKKGSELTRLKFLDSDEDHLLLHVAVKLWYLNNRTP